MQFWNKYPNIFRILFVLGGGLMLALSVVNFTDLSSTPVTGIYPSRLPSQYYVIRDIPGRRITTDNSIVRDTITTGSFILTINDTCFADPEKCASNLRRFSDTEVLKLEIYNPFVSAERHYLVRKGNLPENFYKVMRNAMLIHEIEEGYAADRAGIERGDLLYKIGPYEMTGDDRALRYLRTRESGDRVTYEIIRKNKHMQFDLQLAAFGVSFFSLLAFVTSLIFFGVGFFFALKRPRIFAARLIGVLFLIVATIGSTGFRINPVMLNAITVMSYTLHQICLFMVLPVFIHTTFYFPKEILPPEKRKKLIAIPYIIAIVLLLLGLPPLFVEPMAKLSFIGIVITILMSSIVVYHLVVLLIYRRQLSPEYKKMAKWIYIAFFINILLVVLRGIIYELPWGEMFTVFEYMSVVIYLLIPLAFVYTAGRYHLLDLELRLRRNIQYVIISGFWIVLNIAAFGVVIWYLASSEFAVPNIYIIGSTIEIGPPPIEHSPDSPIRNIILIAFAFLAGYFFWELGKAGLRFLDRKFYRIKFDYGRAATKITELMEKSISAQDLARSLVDKLGELISLKRVGVIIFKDERIVWAQEYYGFKSETLKEFCRMAGDRISEAIAIFKGSFRIDYLPSDLKNIFQECKFLYIIPIRSKGNLTGAIFAGEKLSEISFRNEDLEFLSSIARQASVAIENSFLYEELAQQERMRHELEIARRIQLATLPQEVPRIEGLDIAGVSIPALEVGGDFYDYLNGGSSSLTVVVGDVSGKGTSAALYMSKAQGIMRTLQEFELPPAELLRRTNKLLYKSLEKSYFITAITANIDTNSRKVSFARAGHLPMYHYRYADGSVQRHVPRGLVLGLSKGGLFSSSIQEAGFEYAAGDIFLFITDGVTESRNSAAEEFGERRLMASLKKYAGMPSGDIMNNILSEVSEFSDEEEQFDDMTIVVVKTVSESGS